MSIRARSFVFAVAASVFVAVCNPPRAQASDGYVVGMAAMGAMTPLLAFDITFTIATATGLTYEDEGWAIAQLVGSCVLISAAGVGIGYGVAEGFDGAVGGFAVLAATQGIFLAYAIDALVKSEWAADGPHFGMALTGDGAFVSLTWQG